MANHKPCQIDSTLEIGKFTVHKFTVHCIVQVTDKSVNYYTVYMYEENVLQHYLAFIALLLMELNYAL